MAAGGVVLACLVNFKSKEKKTLTFGYLVTWLLGGVGEPMLFGLFLPYQTPLIAGMISGFISCFVAGVIGLKAYVLSLSNGIYGLAVFLGGPNSNYTLLAISLVVAVLSGFITMWFIKLDERLVK